MPLTFTTLSQRQHNNEVRDNQQPQYVDLNSRSRFVSECRAHTASTLSSPSSYLLLRIEVLLFLLIFFIFTSRGRGQGCKVASSNSNVMASVTASVLMTPRGNSKHNTEIRQRVLSKTFVFEQRGKSHILHHHLTSISIEVISTDNHHLTWIQFQLPISPSFPFALSHIRIQQHRRTQPSSPKSPTNHAIFPLLPPPPPHVLHPLQTALGPRRTLYAFLALQAHFSQYARRT